MTAERSPGFKLSSDAPGYFAKVSRDSDLTDDMLAWKARAALRWGRWLIGADLAAVLAFGLASLLLPLLTRRQERARQAQAAARPVKPA